MKRSIVALAVVGIALSTSTASYADPVTITAGQVGSDFVATGVYLISNSFSLNLFGFDGVFRMPNAFGFQAGDRVDFSATVNGSLVNVSGFPLSVLNGTIYQNQADLLATANLQLTATPVTVTTSRLSGSTTFAFDVFDVTTPFTMSGSIQVARNIGTVLNPVAGESLLSTDIVGSGTLEVRGAGTATDLGVDSPTFKFAAEHPSPTPEPGTFTLFATALAGLIGRRLSVARTNRH